MEKVDLTEEDDGSLDATLGYVAEYEGAGYAEQPDLSVAAMAEAAASECLGEVGGGGRVRAKCQDFGWCFEYDYVVLFCIALPTLYFIHLCHAPTFHGRCW